MSMFRSSGHLSASQSLRSSFLDRLMVEGIDASTQRAGGYVNLSTLREMVKRDVQHLLNTRWRFRGAPAGMTSLRKSMINFGLPDFSGVEMGDPNWRRQCSQNIQRAIQDYEPRLRRVRVTLHEDDESLDRVLRFRVEAELHVEPIREPVVFDSVFNPVNTSFEVKGTSS